MARELNLKVVAEGVETEDQLDYLMHLGCDMIQGYYLSKPLPFDKLETFWHYRKSERNGEKPVIPKKYLTKAFVKPIKIGLEISLHGVKLEAVPVSGSLSLHSRGAIWIIPRQ